MKYNGLISSSMPIKTNIIMNVFGFYIDTIGIIDWYTYAEDVPDGIDDSREENAENAE